MHIRNTYFCPILKLLTDDLRWAMFASQADANLLTLNPFLLRTILYGRCFRPLFAEHALMYRWCEENMKLVPKVLLISGVHQGACKYFLKTFRWKINPRGRRTQRHAPQTIVQSAYERKSVMNPLRCRRLRHLVGRSSSGVPFSVPKAVPKLMPQVFIPILCHFQPADGST